MFQGRFHLITYTIKNAFFIYKAFFIKNYTEPLIYSFFDAVPTDEHHLGLHETLLGSAALQ